MKNIFSTLALSLSILIIGCKEEPPSIAFKQQAVIGDLDTTYLSSTITSNQKRFNCSYK
ncbi:MAG: hypothetical protein HYZ42_01025 [Bacteroidetes bacterium]|nr:hypothetical protein [Bacteroidota bacterium]